MSANEICDLLLRAAPYSTLRSAAHERAVAALASSVGIDCDVTALQDAADRFRLEHGLVTYDQTLAWLSGRGVTPQSWKELLRIGVLEARLRSSAAIGADAKACFDQAPDQYARANVGVLAVEDEGIAREIHLLLTEEGYSFDVLARRYSIEFADPRGSHPVSRRDVWRFQLPLGIADIAFGPGLRVPCDPDPIEVGEVWQVYRIYNVENPIFDPDTENVLRSVCLQKSLRPHLIAAFGSLLHELGCQPPSDLESLVLADDEQLSQRGMWNSLPLRSIAAVKIERMGAE